MDTIRKLLPIIVILTLIIGLPVISYYYLKSGYLFRKDALNKMQMNIPVDFQTMGLEEAELNELYKRVKVFHFQDDDLMPEEALSRLSEVQQLFDESEKFAVVTVGVGPDPVGALADSIQMGKNWIYHSNPNYLDTLSIFDTKKLLLVDTTGLGRAQYTFSEQQMRDLVKHITVLFPVKKRSKIKLERETRQN